MGVGIDLGRLPGRAPSSCLLGIPKTFLPLGDSGFIWGVLIGKTSASPKLMRAYQDQADKVLQANPAVAATFTMTAAGQFLAVQHGACAGVSRGSRESGPASRR